MTEPTTHGSWKSTNARLAPGVGVGGRRPGLPARRAHPSSPYLAHPGLAPGALQWPRGSKCWEGGEAAWG